MKQIFLWILWAAAAAALTGCSTLKVSQDYDSTADFSSLKTFAWQDTNQPETEDIRVDSPLIDQRIRTAITTHLALKGLELSDVDLPDARVAYRYTILSKIRSSPVSTGVGLGYLGGRSISGIGIQTGTDIQQVDQGLLVVDILSGPTGKLLWRGTSTRTVTTHATPEKISQDIDTTIQTLLDQYPPDQKHRE